MVARKIKKKFKRIIRDVWVNSLAASVLTPKIIRHYMYKLYGISTDTKNISPRCFFGSNNVEIGENSFINYECFFDNNELIKVGRNCEIGMRVTFITSNHEIGNADRRSGKKTAGKIIVKDGCWIGANVTILPGVTIGQGCVIAAGSVVTKDCDENSLYAGVPAVKKKELS